MVSCIIPTYKRSDTLTRAIDSVLCQTYEALEVVVVDDNIPGDEYSQNVKRALEKYSANPRVRYIEQEKHINGAVARNVGVKEAKGEYIAFLDDDDEWLPNKIERQVEVMEAEKVEGVSCLYKIYNNGQQTGKCPAYDSEELQFKVLARQVAIFTSTFMCKKECFLSFGGFNPKLLRHQDLQLFTDFLNNGNIYPINEYLVILHTDSEINSPNTEKMIKVKQAFFEAVQETVNKYDNSAKRRIKKAHYFEVVVSAIREKKIKTAMKYLAKIGPDYYAFKDVMNRYKARKK